jgi:cell division septum initiation protein DivIVA
MPNSPRHMSSSNPRLNSRSSFGNYLKGLYKMMAPDEKRPIAALGVPGGKVPAETTADSAAQVQQQALQMLTLAQRTAEEHVAGAQRYADKIQDDARATAEHIIQDAQGQAEAIRREGQQVLSDAKARAAELAKEAQAHLESARRDGDELVAQARARATGIANDAQTHADRLAGQAQLRYEETVGRLAATREALQQQIEALQEFDRDYRSRLLAFIQAHVRALWVDLPVVEADVVQQPTDVRPVLLEARRNGSEVPRSIGQGG